MCKDAVGNIGKGISRDVAKAAAPITLYLGSEQCDYFSFTNTASTVARCSRQFSSADSEEQIPKRFDTSARVKPGL